MVHESSVVYQYLGFYVLRWSYPDSLSGEHGRGKEMYRILSMNYISLSARRNVKQDFTSQQSGLLLHIEHISCS